MSFLFNFPDPATGEATKPEESRTKESTSAKDCQEILEQDVTWDADVPKVTYPVSDTICLKCLDSRAVEARLNEAGESPITQAVQKHSDLIPNVYEGGLKVWECSIDLVQYLSLGDYSFKGKSVLELGCGAGLPGILSLLQGAAHVHFQDYNEEVIKHYTIPNVQLNKSTQSTSNCRFFSGDWSNFVQKMKPENTKYDVILTAETIYQPSCYRKLCEVFTHCLAPKGHVLIAAKSNYFGVGGGTRDFEEYIHKEGIFDVTSCHRIEQGVPREILKLYWKPLS